MTKTAEKPASPRAPGRPRSEATQQAILDATIALLETEDYRDISIDRIAARAKVGKQSIYRWWTSKADLVFEAYAERSLRRLPPYLPSADAYADLEDLLKRFFAVMRTPMLAKGVRCLAAEAQLEPEFRDKFFKEFFCDRRGMVRAVLEHGIAIGQMRNDLELDAAIDLVLGAFLFRLLSGTSLPYDDGYAGQIVAMLRGGLAPCKPCG